jgi:hypothetical protein
LRSSAGLANVNGVWQAVKPTRAKPAAFRYPTRDTRKAGEVAATVARHGKGRIAAVYGPVAIAYYRTHQAALRRFIGDIAARLFPEPAVRVNGPPCVDVHLRRTPTGQLSLHLLNLAEAQRADRFLGGDFIPPVGPIEAEMRTPKRPQGVRWVPKGGRLKWSWSKGVLSVTISMLELHGVIVVE